MRVRVTVTVTVTVKAGLGNTDVKSIPDAATVLEGFRMMAEHNISSVVVTGSQGSGPAILSTSDIKMLTWPHGTNVLALPIHKALAIKFMALPVAMVPCISCTLTSTVGEVASRLEATKVHRIVVIDPVDQRVHAIISILDVLLSLHDSASSNVFG
eukprot:TRINITY_DN1978_c0_g1_i4.p1 TRINITY_DN1978_c0_g1~~TRINITY_DN1978_c0_g1_i4.p1  ORF type:complete len:156 (-),score=44.54 TRINITY_DN1978_c0_g1_i4:173-640(-)